jgi:alkylation response protein AidB-like acyl-CoA dehydrogenase
MGMSWTDENAELWYDNVRIDKRYRIDTQPGQAAQVLKGYVIGYGRLSGGPCLTGLAEGVLETALDWTANRYIAGIPVREHSAFAMAFGDMWRLIDISRQYYLSVTWQATSRNHGRPWSKEMMAKFSAARSFAADAADQVTNKCMEFMGAYGYSFGNQIEKYARDYPIVKLWLGGAQRDRMEIAHGLYGTLGWPMRSEK